MTDEERERAIDFIVAQQARNSVELERLIEAHRRAENRLDFSEQRLGRAEHRLDRYERILRLMIRAGRLKAFLRAREQVSLPVENDAQTADERRRLDRDMDRIERVLSRMLKTDPQTKKRKSENDRRWQEFEQLSKKRFEEIKVIGACTGAKIKALIEDIRRNRSEAR